MHCGGKPVEGGDLFLQKTAPASSSMVASVESYAAGLSTWLANPTVASRPLRLKLSFRDTGSPCRGPTGFPVRAKCSSRALAVSRARAKHVSLRQLVYDRISEKFR